MPKRQKEHAVDPTPEAQVSKPSEGSQPDLAAAQRHVEEEAAAGQTLQQQSNAGRKPREKKQKKGAGGERPLIFFDLNGVLVGDKAFCAQGKRVWRPRPNVADVRQLLPHFTLGVFSSAHQHNIVAALEVVLPPTPSAGPPANADGGGAAGGCGGRTWRDVFTVVQNRAHCVPDRHWRQRVPVGDQYDTIKPLTKHCLKRTILIDNEFSKAAEGQTDNMIVLPTWDSCASHGVHVWRCLIELLTHLGAMEGGVQDVRRYTGFITQAVLEVDRSVKKAIAEKRELDLDALAEVTAWTKERLQKVAGGALGPTVQQAVQQAEQLAAQQAGLLAGQQAEPVVLPPQLPQVAPLTGQPAGQLAGQQAGLTELVRRHFPGCPENMPQSEHLAGQQAGQLTRKQRREMVAAARGAVGARLDVADEPMRRHLVTALSTLVAVAQAEFGGSLDPAELVTYYVQYTQSWGVRDAASARQLVGTSGEAEAALKRLVDAGLVSRVSSKWPLCAQRYELTPAGRAAAAEAEAAGCPADQQQRLTLKGVKQKRCLQDHPCARIAAVARAAMEADEQSKAAAVAAARDAVAGLLLLHGMHTACGMAGVQLFDLNWFINGLDASILRHFVEAHAMLAQLEDADDGITELHGTFTSKRYHCSSPPTVEQATAAFDALAQWHSPSPSAFDTVGANGAATATTTTPAATAAATAAAAAAAADATGVDTGGDARPAKRQRGAEGGLLAAQAAVGLPQQQQQVSERANSHAGASTSGAAPLVPPAAAADATTKRPPPPLGRHSALHHEILSFTADASPSDQELDRLAFAMSAIGAAAGRLWPQSRAQLFGSQASGLALPNSDLDIVVQNVCDVLAAAATARGYGKSGQKRAMALLHPLMAQLKASGVISKQQIVRAKVPIIKARIHHRAAPVVGSAASPASLQQLPSVQADISLGLTNGVECVALIRRAVRVLPPLRPLCLVLKALIKEAGVNEVFTGGISSYSLVNMVIAHLQCEGFDASEVIGGGATSGAAPSAPAAAAQPPPGGSTGGGVPPAAVEDEHLQFVRFLANHPGRGCECMDLGVLLKGFLQRYGELFNYHEEAVSVARGGVIAKPASWKTQRHELLSVEDPQMPGRDIGSGSFNISTVREVFRAALHAIRRAEQRRLGGDDVALPADEAAQWAAVQADGQTQSVSVSQVTASNGSVLQSILDVPLALLRDGSADHRRASASPQGWQAAHRMPVTTAPTAKRPAMKKLKGQKRPLEPDGAPPGPPLALKLRVPGPRSANSGRRDRPAGPMQYMAWPDDEGGGVENGGCGGDVPSADMDADMDADIDAVMDGAGGNGDAGETVEAANDGRAGGTAGRPIGSRARKRLSRPQQRQQRQQRQQQCTAAV